MGSWNHSCKASKSKPVYAGYLMGGAKASKTTQIHVKVDEAGQVSQSLTGCAIKYGALCKY